MASAMPVLPLVASTIVPPGLSWPERLGGVDHRDADAVLDAVGRVVELQLGRDRGAGALADPVEPDQGGVADELGDVVVDAHGTGPPPGVVG